MIRVTFYSDRNSIRGFKMKGHADAGPYGYDIVCAAASVLSISTVNGMIAVAKVHPKVKDDSVNGGFLSVKVPDQLDLRQFIQTQTLLKSFAIGMKAVAKRYSNCIKIKII